MSLKSLVEGRLADYVAENADAADAYWHFIHIPKTAGSSFREELASRLSPQANLHIDRKQKDVPHREQLLAVVKTFREGSAFARCRFASGHIPRILVRSLLNGPRPTRLITMLRDPVERVISDFRYQRTPAHEDRARAAERFPTFESYIRTPGTQNKMYKFLRESPQQSVQDTVASIERSFAFVGFTETYDPSLRLLFRLLGVKDQPKVYARKTESTPANEIPDLDRWRAVIRELNPLDVAVYEQLRARLGSVIERA